MQQQEKQRNLDGSLAQSEEELRDAYLNFKDLKQKCIIDVKQKSGLFDSGMDENQVFYIKPETFLLDEPEKQRVYREDLLRRISQPPKPEPVTNLADELHRSMCQTVADRSAPKLTKATLKNYYFQRQFSLQHMKYKLLCRWAHHVLTSEQLEMISPEATFLYGKLEYNIDQAISRYQRLAQDDYFDRTTRPQTKADGSGYTETLPMPAQSLIREDDVEVYIRGTTYRNKVNKTVNKLISRLKWMPLSAKYTIFENVISRHLQIKQGNLARQKHLMQKVKTPENGSDRHFMSTSDKILNEWRANHDEVPRLISSTQLLKIKVQSTAVKYGLTGDIELDSGQQFCYQVTVHFPANFKRIISKSHFACYDSAQASSKCAIKLKSSQYWLYYVVLRPTETNTKQEAILQQTQADLLLKNAFQFLNVQDLPTLNQVLQETSIQHNKSIQSTQNHPHYCKKQVWIQATDGAKQVEVDQLPQTNSQNLATQLQNHLLSQRVEQEATSEVQVPQHHMLVAMYSLRHLDSLQHKTKLLYVLNYFRAVQRRLAIDLREFATRDRIDGQSNPFIFAQEGNNNAQTHINHTSTSNDQAKKPELNPPPKHTVFDFEKIKQVKDMSEQRGYKLDGQFSKRIFETCPALAMCHTANGEPLSQQPFFEDGQTGNINQRSVKLINRIDFVEIDEAAEEIYVRDDQGIYVMHDCALDDLKAHQDYLVTVGSFYIQRSETLCDPDSKPYFSRDRHQVCHDLLQFEATFQFQKARLCQVYIECYEHVTCPMAQQRLMQIITDVMHRTVRYNLQANYFADAYEAEILLLKKQFELVKTIVDLQISLEKTENHRLQDSLQLSYALANEYSQNRWKYADAETLLQALEQSRKQRKALEEYATRVKQEMQSVKETQEQLVKPREQKDDLPPAPALSSESELNEDNFMDPVGNQFTQLLGMPAITIETIYQSYHETDSNVIQLMKQHSNFIAVYEGYPEFLTMLTHRSILDANLTFKVNEWSQLTGALDFYDSLEVITNVHAVIQSVEKELYESLKMWEPSMMALIDIEVTEASLLELRQVIKIQDGTEVEYKGRELVEDESIVGHSDKMIYFVKEMIADLTTMPKNILDPFLVAKLDVKSVSQFKFPEVAVELNKYSQRKKGISGIAHILAMDKNSVVGLAKEKTTSNEKTIGEQVSVLKSRQITVPSLLQTYCNMVELLRLRHEIIMAATECHILAHIYREQCASVGLKDSRVQKAEGIDFSQHFDQNAKIVDFLEDGPSSQEEIELAVREFDQKLLTNFNFRNPDSFKLNCLTSGLEEVRAILYYQLMQKHTLIVATRQNSLLLDVYERAQSEITTVANHKFALPNSVIDYSQLLTTNSSTISNANIKAMRHDYKQKASQFVAPIFYNVMEKRQLPRTSINKDFGSYLITCQGAFPDSPTTVSRIMRSYRVQLLTKYVNAHLNEVYLDALKVQAIKVCQNLRVFNRYFSFDPQSMELPAESCELLKYESSEMLENFTQAFLPDNYKTQNPNFGLGKKVNKNFDDKGVMDLWRIPSSATLVNLVETSTTAEQLKTLLNKAQKIKEHKWGSKVSLEQSPTEADPETHLKQLLPSFTPHEFSQESKLDYEEAIDFSNTAYAQKCNFLFQLERVIALEWFICQLQLGAQTSIWFEQAVTSGAPFFTLDSYDQRIMHTLELPEKLEGRTKNILGEQIKSLRLNKHIAEALMSLRSSINSVISAYQKTKDDQKSEYLAQYVELRYQQLCGCLYSQLDSFYESENVKGIKAMQRAIGKLTKTDHLRVVYLKPGNYSIQDCVVSPESVNLEAGSLIHGSVPKEKSLIFKRCVSPLTSQKALEPPQISLMQSLYQYDTIRTHSKSQFAGQLPSPIDLSILLDLNEDERKLCAKTFHSLCQQASGFMESVHGDISLNLTSCESAYSLSQIVQVKKIQNEATQAILLRFALLCWTNNCSLPQDPRVVKQVYSRFHQQYIWRVVELKEDLQKKHQASLWNTQPSKTKLHELKMQIDSLVNNHNLSTNEELAHRDSLVKALREEQAELRRRVAQDQYFTIKAQIIVFSHEIHKLIIKASVQTLDSETSALAKCFTLSATSVQYHIHPFQQFAATFFDQVDPDSVLDITNKVDAVQEFLTKIRNRGTEVDTVTSGPGIVLTTKDVNEILVDFCKQSITDFNRQVKSRTETFSLITGQLRDLLYNKDQTIKALQQRLQTYSDNFDSIVSARVFEQGNQLVYELDTAKRVLNVFRATLNGLEQKLVDKILGEQLSKFKRQSNQIDLKDKKFTDYKEHLLKTIENDIQSDKNAINETLKNLASKAKDTSSGRKRTLMYQEGTCRCYKPNPNHPWPTQELALLDKLSEQEARQQLAELCSFIRKQRILFRTKEMFLMTKYQKKIGTLESQLSSNSILWEQLAQSEKRETVLKHELQQTQESLAASRKQIELLTAQLKLSDLDRTRLQKQAERLQHLDTAGEETTPNSVNMQDFLTRQLQIKDEQLQTYKDQQKRFDCSLSAIQKEKEKDSQKYKKSLNEERYRTSHVVEKLKYLQSEVQMFGTADNTMICEAWQRKCIDLFDLCQSLKSENETLKEKLNELVTESSALVQQIQKVPKLPAIQNVQSKAYLEYLNQSEDTGVPVSENSAKLLKPPVRHHGKSHTVMKTLAQQRLLSPAPNLTLQQHREQQELALRKIMSSKGHQPFRKTVMASFHNHQVVDSQPYKNTSVTQKLSRAIPLIASGSQIQPEKAQSTSLTRHHKTASRFSNKITSEDHSPKQTSVRVNVQKQP